MEQGVAMDGVIYRHTVEAFIERVVVRRGLLSLDFDRELKVLGVDASRPKEVSLEVWLAVLRAAARRLSPGKPEPEALEDVGRQMLRGFLDGVVGRGLFMVLRMLGPRRALLRMKENFSTSDSVTSITTREVSPTCIEMEFADAFAIPTYARGILSEAMLMLQVPKHTVEFTELPSGATVFRVSW